jgi:hypothetical protein
VTEFGGKYNFFSPNTGKKPTKLNSRHTSKGKDFSWAKSITIGVLRALWAGGAFSSATCFPLQKPLCAPDRAMVLVRDRARPSPHSFSSLPSVSESVITRCLSLWQCLRWRGGGTRPVAEPSAVRVVRGGGGGTATSLGGGLMGRW